jgi:predicted DCC family thiol-disulfide oxidoreductase YuxK
MSGGHGERAAVDGPDAEAGVDLDVDAGAGAARAGGCGPGALTVMYDGACPLCRREIALYRGLPADVRVDFEDVSDPAVPVPLGADRTALLARFHVRTADGRWLDGARAFVALWAVMPGWRWLARLGRLPGAAVAMEAAYRGFLRVRPAMQWLARRLDARDRAA